MEVNKSGQVTFPGKVFTNSLQANSANIASDINVGGQVTIQGDLIVTGNIHGLPEQKLPDINKIESGVLYLGKESIEGLWRWRIRVDENQIYFEKYEGDEWNIKQSLM